MTKVIAKLNDRWRIVDNPHQWILQVREGRQTSKASGWRGRSYCAQRTALRRCIQEYCGEVDPLAVAIIEGLPERRRKSLG